MIIRSNAAAAPSASTPTSAEVTPTEPEQDTKHVAEVAGAETLNNDSEQHTQAPLLKPKTTAEKIAAMEKPVSIGPVTFDQTQVLGSLYLGLVILQIY